MSRWTLAHSGETTLLHRTGHPVHWSLAVARTLAGSLRRNHRIRLAHQIRQDIWRACRDVRGFLPLVEVSTSGTETVIRAGGSLMTRSGHVPTLETRIARVLDCADNIARWQKHAQRARG